jgi:hypothetical protein
MAMRIRRGFIDEFVSVAVAGPELRDYVRQSTLGVGNLARDQPSRVDHWSDPHPVRCGNDSIDLWRNLSKRISTMRLN